MAYLVDNPPARPQFRPRRQKPTGLIVLHSAENVPDLNPPDTGAEKVSKFIKDRPDPGSYHFICDADSTIDLVELDQEAFQDGTGSNPYAVAVSGAFSAAGWRNLPEWWRDGCVDQMARACVEASQWLEKVHGITVPAVQLTREQSNTEPGFISHAHRDPARRSDPGAEVVALVIARFKQLTQPTTEVVDMTPAIVRFTHKGKSKRAVFKVGGNGQAQWKVDDGPWVDFGGKFTSGLDATSSGDTIEVVGLGTDGKPWMTTFNGAVWTGWSRL